MLTNQQHANELLAHWQQKRREGEKPENIFGDIGNMTFGLRANAKDVYDTWMKNPERRKEYGDRERTDIAEAVLCLTTLLREISRNG